MRTKRKQGDKPEETAGKNRRMDRLNRMAKKPRQLASGTALVLALAAILCACTSTGAGGEGGPPALPEGVSIPPAVSAELPPAPTESVTEPEPSQPEPAPTLELEPSPEPDTAGGDFQAFVWGENIDFDRRYQSFESEAAFLAAFGFAGTQPSYQCSYTDDREIWSDGKLEFAGKTVKWELYYNEETGAGCAVRESIAKSGVDDADQNKKSVYGYAFMETQPAEGDWPRWDRWEMDWFSPPKELRDMGEDYREHYEYDEDGRVLYFETDGIWDAVGDDMPERNGICWASFSYNESGTLRYRSFGKSYRLDSYQMNQRSWFDELGRVCYESCYITHGMEEFLYFYDGDSTTPAYCLYLDTGGSGVIFGKY